MDFSSHIRQGSVLFLSLNDLTVTRLHSKTNDL